MTGEKMELLKDHADWLMDFPCGDKQKEIAEAIWSAVDELKRQEKFSMTIGEAISMLFERDEKIAIWNVREWGKSIAWEGWSGDLPEEYKDKKDWKIFGIRPVHHEDSNRINFSVHGI